MIHIPHSELLVYLFLGPSIVLLMASIVAPFIFYCCLQQIRSNRREGKPWNANPSPQQWQNMQKVFNLASVFLIFVVSLISLAAMIVYD